MISVSFKFDLGRYHGTPWRANVNDGAIEWPPSPWRVMRSMIAPLFVDAGLADFREDGLAAVGELARSDPPKFHLPRGVPAHTRHYFPSLSTGGKTALVIDGFMATTPDAELLVSWNTDLSAQQEEALKRACSCIRYLGRSESLCTVELIEDPVDSTLVASPLTDAESVERGDIVHLLAVAPDDPDPVSTLTTSPDGVRSKRLKLPPGSIEVPYLVPTAPDQAKGASRIKPDRPTIAIYRLRGGFPGLKDAVVVGEELRRKMQSAFDSRGESRRSPTFSGHGPDGKRLDQHQHAHYLSLPGREPRLIERLAIWAPEGFGDEEVEAIARAAREKLKLPGDSEPIEIGLVALGDATTLDLPTLNGPSRTWESVTPFALPRFPKRRGGRMVETAEDQVIRELGARTGASGESLATSLSRVESIKADWNQFRSSRASGSNRRNHITIGLRLVFDEPVSGPLSLGALSHFGLGLFEAVDRPQ